jgi:hypothetical protein
MSIRICTTANISEPKTEGTETKQREQIVV